MNIILCNYYMIMISNTQHFLLFTIVDLKPFFIIFPFAFFSSCSFFIWLPSNFNNYFMNNNKINLGAKSLIIVNS